MDFLSVSPRLGTLVDDSISAESTLPPYLYINWKDKDQPFTVWWVGESGSREMHVVDPGYSTPTIGPLIPVNSDLLLPRWPELFLVWTARTSGEPFNRIRWVDVRAGGPSEPLTEPTIHMSPFAHPNGKVYWTERTSEENVVKVVQWEPPGTPQVITILNTVGGSKAIHRNADGEDLFIHYNSVNPSTAFVVNLATGSTIDTPSALLNSGIYSFADPEVDQLPGQFGGAYGKTSGGIRGSYETNRYIWGLSRVSTLSNPSTYNSVRFNASRKAMVSYHFSTPQRGLLKWFDISQPSTAPVNSDPSIAVEEAPLLDLGNLDSFPDQIYPAAIEPFA